MWEHEENTEIVQSSEAFARVADPVRRAWLIAYAECGIHTEASRAVGRSSNLYQYWLKTDPEFKRAYEEVAIPLVGRSLQDEAVRRAKYGRKKYKFTSSGEPVRHPELCVCDHHIDAHYRRRNVVTGQPEWVCPGFDQHDPDAQTFYGIPYSERETSDTLLRYLLDGFMPEMHGRKLKIQKVVEQIDYSRLPNDLLDRIIQGENPLNVLAELASPQEAEVLSQIAGEEDQEDSTDDA